MLLAHNTLNQVLSHAKFLCQADEHQNQDDVR